MDRPSYELSVSNEGEALLKSAEMDEYPLRPVDFVLTASDPHCSSRCIFAIERERA